MPTTITITLSDADIQALAHDVVEPEQWIRNAVAGKIAACTKRMILDAREVLDNDPAVDTVPADRDALITAYTARPDYRNRKKRDADEEAERQAAIKAAEEAERAQAERDEQARAAMEQAMKEAAEAGERQRQEQAEAAERALQARIDEAVAKALKDAKAGKS